MKALCAATTVLVAALTPYEILASSVRSNNGANCVGVSSCRPRCITFQLERDVSDCDTMTGAFAVTSDINPWDTKAFKTYNCQNAGTCMNDRCGEPLPANMTIRIGEEGYTGSYYHTFVELSEDEDSFTFCSIYPCPKDECALPEQMGYELQIEIVDSDEVQERQLIDTGDGHMFLSPDFFSLGFEIVLKAAFVGEVLSGDVNTSYGPLSITWMDDPTGCRVGYLPYYTPVAPLTDPHVMGINAFLHVKETLYCSGDEYLPSPLPIASSAPSSAPSTSPLPTAKPTLSAIQTSQIEGLRALFDTLNMDKSLQQKIDYSSYCSFTGVECSGEGYITSIVFGGNMNLSGKLTTSSLKKLKRLQRFRIVGNKVSGPLPDISMLKQLVQIELPANDFTGTIPDKWGESNKVKRILLNGNDLSGSVPASLCKLESLRSLDVSNNVRLEGTVPECIGELGLAALRVGDIGLIGAVPSSLCNSTRDMNGLTPNIYGCDAIACPAGTYEPLNGRQTSDDTPCLECTVPSNVIGSTECMLVEGNEVITVEPTVSQEPSSVFSSTPSQTPTTGSSLTGMSTASHTPSPSFAPTKATVAPTPSSGMYYVEFSLQLRLLHSLMDEETLPIFESIARNFTRVTALPNINGVNATISTVTVMGQELKNANNKSEIILQSTGTSSLRTLLEGQDDGNISKDSGDSVLFVTTRVEGQVQPYPPPPEFSFEDTVLYGFRNNMTAFIASLQGASAFFIPGGGGAPSSFIAPVTDTNDDRSNRFFLGFMIPLIIICCLLSAFLLVKNNKSSRNELSAKHSERPLSLMPSGSSIEQEIFRDAGSPPPPPPHHHHTSDVHRCTSAMCSSCDISKASSGLYFLRPEHKEKYLEKMDVASPIPFQRSIDEMSPRAHRATQAESFEEELIPYPSYLRNDKSAEWNSAPEHGTEWREIGGEI